MVKERCRENDHLWVCLQQEGVLGEIKNRTVLDIKQIESVNDNLKMAEEVCPNGVIVCNKCNQTLISSQSITRIQIDPTDLKDKLVK